jgi:opacity protein-like surface antigen
MKKVILTAIFLVFLIPCFSFALTEKEATNVQLASVIADRADVFLEASQHSIVIDTIPRGTTVTLFPSGKKDKKWLYISYLSEKRGSQVTGFIDTRRVEIIQEKPGPEEEETQEVQQESVELKDLLKEMGREKKKAERQEQTPEVEGNKPEVVQPEQRKEQQEARERQEPQPEEKDLPETEEEERAVQKSDHTTQEMEETQREEPALPAQEETQPEEDHAVEETRETETEEPPKVLTKVAVKVPRANIRLMPTTKSPIIQQVTSGVELQHMAKTSNWHRVNLAPNKEGIVLSGYIHNNIVHEIFEPAAPPGPKPEEIPEIVPRTIEEEKKPAPEPEPVQEIPTVRTPSLGKYYWVGGGAGYTMPSASQFGNGLSLSGTFGFGLMKHLAVEFRIPYFQSDVNGSAEGLSSGRFSSLSLMLSLQGRYPIKDRFIPYIVAGGDYHLNKFNLNNEIMSFWNDLGFNIQESVDHTFGFHLGAGLDFFLFRNIVFNLDVRYFTANMKGNRTLAHQISQEVSSGSIDSLKLNSLQAGISVKLYFDPLRKK